MTSENSRHMNKLLRGAGLSVLNLGLGLVLGLILSPYIVRMLGDRHYGIYALAGTFTVWFSLLDLGLNSAVSRFVTLHFAKNEYDKCHVISNTAFFLYVLLGAAGLLISTCISAGALLFYPQMADVNLFSMVIVIFGVAFMLSIPMNAFSGTVQGVIRSDLVEITGFIFRVLGALQTVLILRSGGRLIPLALGNVALVLINVSVLYFLAKKTLPGMKVDHRLFQKDQVRSLFGYSVYTLVKNVGSMLIMRTGTLIVASFVSLSAVTHYQVIACNLSYNFMSLMLAMTAWLTSWLTLLHSRGEHETLRETMRLGYKFSVYLASFIAFGLIAWGPAFITRWMGTGYLDAYPSLVVITLTFWFSLSQTVNNRYLFAIAQHKYLAYSQIAEGVLNLIVSLILVQRYGMLGVAIGLAIGGVCGQGIAIPVMVCRFLKVNLAQYYGELALRMLISAVALLPPFLVTRYWVAPSYPALIGVGVACTVLYFPVIYYLGFVSADRAKMRSVLLKRA